MKSLFRLLVAVFLVAGWTLAALCLHVVQTPTKILLLTRQRPGLTDIYVDARKWKPEHVPQHPDVFERVLQSKQSYLFAYMFGAETSDDVSGMVSDALKHAKSEKKGKSGEATARAWWDIGG